MGFSQLWLKPIFFWQYCHSNCHVLNHTNHWLLNIYWSNCHIAKLSNRSGNLPQKRVVFI